MLTFFLISKMEKPRFRDRIKIPLDHETGIPQTSPPQRLKPEKDENNLAALGIALQLSQELEHGRQQEVDPGNEDGWKVVHPKL